MGLIVNIRKTQTTALHSQLDGIVKPSPARTLEEAQEAVNSYDSESQLFRLLILCYIFVARERLFFSYIVC